MQQEIGKTYELDLSMLSSEIYEGEINLEQIRIKLKGDRPFYIDEENLEILRNIVKKRNESVYESCYIRNV